MFSQTDSSPVDWTRTAQNDCMKLKSLPRGFFIHLCASTSVLLLLTHAESSPVKPATFELSRKIQGSAELAISQVHLVVFEALPTIMWAWRPYGSFLKLSGLLRWVVKGMIHYFSNSFSFSVPITRSLHIYIPRKNEHRKSLCSLYFFCFITCLRSILRIRVLDLFEMAFLYFMYNRFTSGIPYIKICVLVSDWGVCTPCQYISDRRVQESVNECLQTGK